MLFAARNGGTQRVEPILARLQDSLEILPRPISPLQADTHKCDNSSTDVLDEDERVAFIQNSRLASDQSREGVFSEEEYAFFSQVLYAPRLSNYAKQYAFPRLNIQACHLSSKDITFPLSTNLRRVG